MLTGALPSVARVGARELHGNSPETPACTSLQQHVYRGLSSLTWLHFFSAARIQGALLLNMATLLFSSTYTGGSINLVTMSCCVCSAASTPPTPSTHCLTQQLFSVLSLSLPLSLVFSLSLSPSLSLSFPLTRAPALPLCSCSLCS